MRANKGKWFELCYCLLRLQATLKCETQIGYCNLSPRALVAHTLEVGDTVKYLQLTVPRGVGILSMFHQWLLAHRYETTNTQITHVHRWINCLWSKRHRQKGKCKYEGNIFWLWGPESSLHVCMGLKSKKLTLVLTDDLHSISMWIWTLTLTLSPT